MLLLCGLPFLLGILNLVLKSLLDDADPYENRIEWISALLMQAYFVVLYLGLAYHGILDRRQHPLVPVWIGKSCVC